MFLRKKKNNCAIRHSPFAIYVITLNLNSCHFVCVEKIKFEYVQDHFETENDTYYPD